MNIQPTNQSVEDCLKKRTYYIDFYQREYIWSKKIVKILLDDIFFKFDLSYEEHKNKDLTPEVLAKYDWYYLNTYITNEIEGKEYIVDGQQRLTTLTLIAIKLLQLSKQNPDYFANILDSLKDCIFGKDKFKGNIFWIDNDKRQRMMQRVINNEKFSEEYSCVTEENIYENYNYISKYIDQRNLSDEELRVFIMYFLERLVLVELKIEKDDTPMVFEVINDRGVSLKPFEILKGILVGALNKDDTEKYSALWETALNKLRGIEDDFFIDFIKGKYIYKRNAENEKSINNQYHRYIFETNDASNNLRFRRKDHDYMLNIKNFIEKDLTYYAKLYSKTRKNEDTYLRYNNEINSLSGQYQNIIACCEINDPKQQLKIENISREIDRLYMLLRLNGIYDSNDFQELSYQLNHDLKDKPIEQYREVFDDLLTGRIKEKFNLSEVSSLLEYERFKSRGYDNTEKRALRYLFARIDEYICSKIGMDTERSVQYISTKTGPKTGYHIEHIFSRNDENINFFQSEEEFERNRNRLGALLLLYSLDNITSNNEKYYSGKRKTYSNGLMWGRTLIDTFYHKTNTRFHEFKNQFEDDTGVKFMPIDIFNDEALEYRSKLLYELVKTIWEVN